MNFLLLHGAWHGGWAWDEVAERLRTAGHAVCAPDLPGLGADAGNLSPDIGLEEHVATCIPQTPAIICAHSYAGVPVRVALDRHPERIIDVVLIEALWPDNGECAKDQAVAKDWSVMEAAIAKDGDGWRIPNPHPSRFDLTDPELEAFVGAKITDHPAKTYYDPVQVSGPDPIGTYLIANDRDPQPYTNTANRLASRGWCVEETTGGHELMLTRPDFIADLLLKTVAGIRKETT